MPADPIGRPQLGELLVTKGLITDAQLRHALAEQQRSPAPLGKIIVELGYTSGPAIANTLAEQHGGPLRTEYGLSLGPTGDGARPLELSDGSHPEVAAQPPPSLRLAGSNDESAELEQIEADLADARGRAASLEAQLRRSLQESVQRDERVGELERQLEQARAESEAHVPPGEVDALRRGLAQHEETLAEAGKAAENVQRLLLRFLQSLS